MFDQESLDDVFSRRETTIEAFEGESSLRSTIPASATLHRQSPVPESPTGRVSLTMTGPSAEQELIAAARSGDLSKVDALLVRGTEPDSTDQHGHTPLALAVIYGHEEVVSRLLDAGADVGASDDAEITVLMTAAEFSRPEIVRMLIDAGADVNSVAIDGRTALLSAIWSADSGADVVRVLIEAGADVTAADENYGLSPRQWAEKTGRHDVAHLLAEAE